MNLKKLMDKINSLADQIQNLVDSEKFDEAAELRAQYDAAVAQYNALKDMDLQHMQQAGAPASDPVDEESKRFFNALRAGFTNIMTEGTDTDGGYTVPSDVQTKINQYKETHRSLRDEVTVEVVTTDKGSRVYETRTDVQGFQEVDENGLLPALDEPKFEQVNYAIKDYGGYLPVTNDLLRDSDANIEAKIVEWIGKNSLKTDNNKILALWKAGEVVEITDIDDITDIVVSDIGSAYSCKIITNDDGVAWLSKLKDTTGRSLLNPDPTQPKKKQLGCGSTVVYIEQYPNADIASEYTYKKTSDTKITSGKKYFTLADEKYSRVKKPVVADIANYYEIDTATIPMFIGEFKEASHIYDRQQTTMLSSDVAAVVNSSGSVVYNAFQQRGRLYRADARMDYKTIDTEAWRYGQVTI